MAKQKLLREWAIYLKDLEKIGSIGKPIPRGKFTLINKEKYNKING